MFYSTIKRSNNSKSKCENKDRPVYQSLKTILDFFKPEPKKVTTNKGKLKFGHIKNPWNSSDTSINRNITFTDDLTIKNSSILKLSQNQRSSSYKSLKSIPDPSEPKKNFHFYPDNKAETYFPTIQKSLKHIRVNSQYELRCEPPRFQESSYRSKKLRSNTKFEPIAETRSQIKLPNTQNPSFKHKDCFTISGWDTENQ